VIQNGIITDVKASYLIELALATEATALLARLNLLLCAGQLSAASQTLILGALNAMAAGTDAQKRNRVNAAVLLVMASADYLVQK
jgi:energy-converting hydrogenase Eha subunit H